MKAELMKSSFLLLRLLDLQITVIDFNDKLTINYKFCLCSRFLDVISKFLSCTIFHIHGPPRPVTGMALSFYHHET
jgi:hypothetical protein